MDTSNILKKFTSRKQGSNLTSPFLGSEVSTSQVHFSETRFQPSKPISRKRGFNLVRYTLKRLPNHNKAKT